MNTWSKTSVSLGCHSEYMHISSSTICHLTASIKSYNFGVLFFWLFFSLENVTLLVLTSVQRSKPMLSDMRHCDSIRTLSLSLQCAELRYKKSLCWQTYSLLTIQSEDNDERKRDEIIVHRGHIQQTLHHPPSCPVHMFHRSHFLYFILAAVRAMEFFLFFFLCGLFNH